MLLPRTALPVHSRIAPTPSGYLHTGNVYSFLLTWLIVRLSGGTLLLRIDDMDAARKRPEFLGDIFETLEWLKITYDLGPTGPDDFEKNYSQLHRLPLYHRWIEELTRTGLVFACVCTRTRTTSQQSLPHRCSCEKEQLPLSSGSLRVRVPEDAACVVEPGRTVNIGKEQGNFVVRRRDGLPAYQVTSIADDEHFGIDTIVRGEDLFASSGMQMYLLEKLGKKTPAFHHHPLLLDSAGGKLSKSTKAPSIALCRSQGGTAGELIDSFCAWAGLDAGRSLEEVLAQVRAVGKKT